MSTVWLVTKGTYSDYGIVAAYASRELAERACELLGSDAQVEDYELYEDRVGLVRRGAFKVPRVRRSGEPTVVDAIPWSNQLVTDDEELRESWLTDWQRRKPAHVKYWGERSAAFACARAMSMQLHGEVVLDPKLKDGRG